MTDEEGFESDSRAEEDSAWAKIVEGIQESDKTTSEIARQYREEDKTLKTYAYQMDVNVYSPDSEDLKAVQTIEGFTSQWQPPLLQDSHPDLDALITAQGYLGFSNIQELTRKDEAEYSLVKLQSELLMIAERHIEDEGKIEELRERFEEKLDEFLD